jgi:hypothetical protein
LSRKSTHACGKLARGLIFLQTPKERLKDMVRLGRRFPCGLPRTDNVNDLWIQLFRSVLNATGHSEAVDVPPAAIRS